MNKRAVKIFRIGVANVAAFWIAWPVLALYGIHVAVEWIVCDRVWSKRLLERAEAFLEWGKR